jgi:hypothetical protein
MLLLPATPGGGVGFPAAALPPENGNPARQCPKLHRQPSHTMLATLRSYRMALYLGYVATTSTSQSRAVHGGASIHRAISRVPRHDLPEYFLTPSSRPPRPQWSTRGPVLGVYAWRQPRRIHTSSGEFLKRWHPWFWRDAPLHHLYTPWRSPNTCGIEERILQSRDDPNGLRQCARDQNQGPTDDEFGISVMELERGKCLTGVWAWSLRSAGRAMRGGRWARIQWWWPAAFGWDGVERDRDSRRPRRTNAPNTRGRRSWWEGPTRKWFCMWRGKGKRDGPARSKWAKMEQKRPRRTISLFPFSFFPISFIFSFKSQILNSNFVGEFILILSIQFEHIGGLNLYIYKFYLVFYSIYLLNSKSNFRF